MLLIFILLIIIINWYLYATLQNLHNDLLSGLIGASFNGCLTIFLIYIAWKELDSISKTSNAEFLIKFKDAFFTKETRNLIHLIDNDYLEFVNTEELGKAFFKIKEEMIDESTLDKEIKDELKKKMAYSTYQMDDFILGHFEDLGIFEQKGSLDIEMVYEEFSWYLITVWENCAIKKYIQKQREESEDIYDKFEYIKDKCESFEKAKVNKKSISLWKIKYWIHTKFNL